MTIDERIAQLARVKHYAAPRHYETLDMAIETMRKYQKIEELYDYWRSGKCEYTISCMENIGKVLRDGNDDCHLAIKALEQEPKTGHWIRVDKDKLKCSKCDVIHFIAQYPQGKIVWCPNCGAIMESEVEE